MPHNSAPRGILRVAMLVVLTVLLAACTTSTGTPITRDGRSAADLAGKEGSAVILVVTPAYCFACATRIAEWLRQSRTSGIPVHVVLTELPSQDEALLLRRQRIPVVGELAPRARWSIGRPPAVLVIRDHRVTTSGTLSDPAIVARVADALLRSPT